jgi:hypothetical protein
MDYRELGKSLAKFEDAVYKIDEMRRKLNELQTQINGIRNQHKCVRAMFNDHLNEHPQKEEEPQYAKNRPFIVNKLKIRTGYHWSEEEEEYVYKRLREEYEIAQHKVAQEIGRTWMAIERRFVE